MVLKRALLVFLLVPTGLQAQSPEVKGLVAEYMSKNKIPAVTLAIVKDGKAEIHAFGTADIENNVPAKPETVYQIGSVTKQFTATLVMRLVEQGKVKLTDGVLSYLPDLPKEWAGVTIKHLLNHTSGIKSYTGIAGFGGLMVRSGQHADLVNLITAEKMDYDPGEKWSYNNSGYYLLGMIIEKVTGKTYREALKHEILTPLGLEHTDLFAWTEVVPHRARGYMGGRNAPYLDMTWPYAAGSLLSTAPDLLKWEAAQGSDKLLKPESWSQMWAPTVLNDQKTFPYGFGWSLDSVSGSKVIEHNGGIPGFSAQINRYPDKKVAVIILTNGLGGNLKGLAENIAGSIDPTLAKPKLPTLAIVDTDPPLTTRLKKVFADTLAGKAEPSEFDEVMQKLLFPDTIHAVRGQLAAMGELGAFDLVEAVDTATGKRRVYLATLGDTKVRVSYTLAKDGKISGYLIQPT